MLKKGITLDLKSLYRKDQITQAGRPERFDLSPPCVCQILPRAKADHKYLEIPGKLWPDGERINMG